MQYLGAHHRPGGEASVSPTNVLSLPWTQPFSESQASYTTVFVQLREIEPARQHIYQAVARMHTSFRIMNHIIPTFGTESSQTLAAMRTHSKTCLRRTSASSTLWSDDYMKRVTSANLHNEDVGSAISYIIVELMYSSSDRCTPRRRQFGEAPWSANFCTQQGISKVQKRSTREVGSPCTPN